MREGVNSSNEVSTTRVSGWTKHSTNNLSCPFHALNLRGPRSQDLAVEKQQGIEGLILSRRRELFIDGEMRKKGADCVGIQFPRMALAVKEDEPLDPIAISFFGADTEVPEASDVGDLIEQLFLDHSAA